MIFSNCFGIIKFIATMAKIIGTYVDTGFIQSPVSLFYISIDSPMYFMLQNPIPFASVNSFILHADSNPLAVKCIGTNSPTLNLSMNCLPPFV